MQFELDSENLNAYLVSDEIIDWDKDAIKSKAREITSGLTNDIAQARLLFEWVRDTIPHTSDAGREEVTCMASQVLEMGTGICYAKAHLLAAMLRACGIPAGFCYQVYIEPEHNSVDKIAMHGLNGLYLRSLDRWIRVDSRGNKEGVNAQFAIEYEQLAFPELEFLDNRIYAKPLPNVVEALRKWPTRSSLWPNLPTPEPTPGLRD
jgi:transglutaminase-like putative cysteine protease